MVSLFLLALAVQGVPHSQEPSIALTNGRWLVADDFQPDTFYAVAGILTRRRPERLDSVIDLHGGFVVPAAGDAHQHRLNDPKQIAEDTRQFLGDGVFYVMVQDAIVEPAPEVLHRLNVPQGVDVVYTRAPLLGSQHGLTVFFQRLAAEGMFGARRTMRELREEDAALAARRGTIVITTVSPKPFFDYQRWGERFRRVQRENLRMLQHHGVRMAIGADGEETSIGELRAIQRLRVFDNPALLRMLVETTPQAIFPSRQIGKLDEGYEANLLVLGGDPLRDLEHLSDIKLRMKQGRVLR